MSSGRYVVRSIALCLVLFLAGCTVTRPPGSEPAPVEEEPDYTTVTPPATTPQPPPQPTEPSISSAWQPLVDRAERARGRGDYTQALALLERAQRIDPNSGEIYLQLARTHKASGDVTQARATAERGLLYCSTPDQCKALGAIADGV